MKDFLGIGALVLAGVAAVVILFFYLIFVLGRGAVEFLCMLFGIDEDEDDAPPPPCPKVRVTR